MVNVKIRINQPSSSSLEKTFSLCYALYVRFLEVNLLKKPSGRLQKLILRILLRLFLIVAIVFLFSIPRGTEDYLVYGIDQYGSLDADGRSDAMMLLRLDHRNRCIYTVSMARDMFIEQENGRMTKINTVVRGDPNAGGETLSGVVSRNFGLTPDGWVRINFSSLVSVVDALGGVRVTLSAKEARYIDRDAGRYAAHPLAEGECLLTGGQALSFVRCRHLDDDLGRGQRQSRFAAAMAGALSRLRPSEIRALYVSMNHAWRTSLSSAQQAALLFRALFARHYRVIRLQLPFEGTWRYGNQGSVPGILADLPENRKLLAEAFNGTE